MPLHCPMVSTLQRTRKGTVVCWCVLLVRVLVGCVVSRSCPGRLISSAVQACGSGARGGRGSGGSLSSTLYCLELRLHFLQGFHEQEESILLHLFGHWDRGRKEKKKREQQREIEIERERE